MKIRVKFFALYRQLSRKEEITLELPPGVTIAQLSNKLMEDFPRISQAAIKPLIAVNAEYASPELTLKNGDVVAMLPPFSGGKKINSKF